MDPGRLGPFKGVFGAVVAALCPLTGVFGAIVVACPLTGVLVAMLGVWVVSDMAVAEAAQPRSHDSFLQAEDAPEDAGGDSPEPEAAEEDPSDSQAAGRPGVFATPDRTVLRLLGKARQLLGQDRYAEAVRCLGAILDSPEDYFFQPEKTDPVYRSLKSEAQRLLGEMPRRGRQLYELQYGARARRMLRDAAAAGDTFELGEVSRRFFHTQAGYEATLLLGLDHLNQGRPLAAALTLQRLREASPSADQFEPMLSTTLATCWIRAGLPDKAWQALASLRARYPDQHTVTIAGEEVLLFPEGSVALEGLIQRDEALGLLAEEDNPLGKLASLVGLPATAGPRSTDQWTMFRGNATRNGSASGSRPLLSLLWAVRATEHPCVEALIDEFSREDREENRPAIPALHALAVDDVVLMRTARTLVAVDLVSGKRIWEVPVDDPFEVLSDPAPETGFRRRPQLYQGLRLRVWGDATYGRMSSDGRCVFTIEDLGFGGVWANVPGVLVNAQRRGSKSTPGLSNRLAAYDVQTGKLKWHVGGEAEEYGLAQAGAFFLGPPLPLMDQLFVLAEVQGEIRLMSLDRETGELLWSQPLADAERDVLNDPLRRLAGVSPSYADGVLVCPTSENAIVALELATRSLLWGYAYTPENERVMRQVMLFGVQAIPDPDPVGRWTDSSVILADGRVLLTPVESDQLHCLDLMDGKLFWKRPRQDDLYLACVYRDNVVLVGTDHVRALRLDDGEPAWENRTVAFPEGSRPSGLGFLSGGLYYVPLTSAEVMAVDVAAGRPACVSKSRRGNVPGNLICYRDRIISQRADAVEAFYQLDALEKLVDRRLAENKDDAEALARKGEILWQEGKLDEAIGAFRRSLESAPDPNTRELLRAAWFDGLRLDFAAHRRRVEEIEELIDKPDQRAMFLRLMGVGLQSAGEFTAALESYLELIDLDQDHRGMERVERSLVIRRDRWIRGQLAALRGAATSEMRAEIDRAVQTRLKAAVEEEDAAALARFLEYFGSHPVAEDGRGALVRKLQASGRLLEAELLLRRQERSKDSRRAANAVAELAGMLRGAGRWRDSAVCYRRLKGQFADVACLDGESGKQVVDALPADDPVRLELEQVAPWPVGRVEVEIGSPKKTSVAAFAKSTVEYQGSPAPFFSDSTIELHMNPPRFVARDGLGGEQWSLAVSELPRQQRFVFNRNPTRVAVCGHLLLVLMGSKMLAVDTLAGSDGGPPRMLWVKDLDESVREVTAGAKARIPVANLAAGMQPFRFAGGYRAATDVPEVLSEDLLCVTWFRNCVAVDPATGETLWVRQDVPPGSSVFGDHEYVFVVPSEGTAATVLRALDGTLVGTREVSRRPERLTTIGRRVLVRRNSGNRSVLELVDAWTGEKVWPSREFAADAALSLVDRQAVAVLERSGRFVLLDLTDGRALIEAELEPEPSLSSIFVLPSASGYVLITQAAAGDDHKDPNRYVQPMRGTQSAKINRGRVYAFDHRGNKLWPAPVSVQDQFLPLDQPGRLPVLTFASVVTKRANNRRVEASTFILGIDKRNGRVILNKQLPGSTNCFQLCGDPQRKMVDVQLQRNTITMTFTDKPLAAESDRGATSSPEPRDERTIIQAIWDAIRRATIGPAGGARGHQGAARPVEPSTQRPARPAGEVDSSSPSVPGGEVSGSGPSRT